MKRAFLFVLFAAAPAVAQQPAPATPAPAYAPPPGLMLAKVENGGLVRQVFETYMVREKRTVDQVVEGKVVKVEVEVAVPKTGSKSVVQPLKDLKITDVAGKPIPEAKVAELLKTETVVVVSYFGDIADVYRKPFKEGTVFIVFPPPGGAKIEAPAAPKGKN